MRSFGIAGRLVIGIAVDPSQVYRYTGRDDKEGQSAESPQSDIILQMKMMRSGFGYDIAGY